MTDRWPETAALTTGGFARAVQSRGPSQERLQRGAELVVEMVSGCDHAGVTIASGHEVTTAAATDELVRRGDAWQYELHEGPCLDAVREQHSVITQDLAVETRWRRWGPRAYADLGVNAMMSLPLSTDQLTLGALNLYAVRRRPWSDGAVALGHELADQLATALADAREIEGRTAAMANRTMIGQAEGILMERFGLDADHAFDYLRRISQTSNRKLIAVATDIVETRRLPDAPPPSSRPHPLPLPRADAPPVPRPPRPRGGS